MRKTSWVAICLLAVSCTTCFCFVLSSQVALWSPRLHAILKGNASEVTLLIFSPDGKTLVSGSKDGATRLWNVENGRLEITLDEFRVFWLAFLPDSKTLAAGGEDALRLWDVSSGKLKATIEGDGPPLKNFALSPDGKLLLIIDVNDQAFLWDVRNGQRKVTLQRPPRGEVRTIAFSPDSKMVAAGSDDRLDSKGTVWVWAVTDGQLYANLQGHTGAVLALTFTRDGKLLATGGVDKTVRLWDVVSRQLKATLQAHKEQVEHLAFSPDGETLATGSLDQTALLWSLRERRVRAVLRHKKRVTQIAFADGTLATGSYDRVAQLWDVTSGRLKATLTHEKGSTQTIAFSPDGKMIATGGGYTQFLEQYGEARLWLVSDGK